MRDTTKGSVCNRYGAPSNAWQRWGSAVMQCSAVQGAVMQMDDHTESTNRCVHEALSVLSVIRIRTEYGVGYELLFLRTSASLGTE